MTLMKTSENGKALIREFEGLRLTAYKAVPTEKYYTIGYGHYGADITKGMTITKERAEELLTKDITPIEQHLNAMMVNFTQNEFDALVSLIFNIGIGNFKTSTLRRKIMENRDDDAIHKEFLKWVYSGGVMLPGLVKRREREANLFLRP